MSTPGNESYSTGRRWGGWVNCALAVLSVLALAAMANYLSYRHYTRASVAENIDLEFSSRTELMLRQLDSEVNVTVSGLRGNPEAPPPRRLRSHDVLACGPVSREAS